MINTTKPTIRREYRKFLTILAFLLGFNTLFSEFAHANDVLVLNEKPVVLYGTSWCSYCKSARAYLRSHNIEFTDYDIETSEIAQKKFKALKGKGVPLIFVGKVRIDGYDEKTLEKALRANGLLPMS